MRPASSPHSRSAMCWTRSTTRQWDHRRVITGMANPAVCLCVSTESSDLTLQHAFTIRFGRDLTQFIALTSWIDALGYQLPRWAMYRPGARSGDGIRPSRL